MPAALGLEIRKEIVQRRDKGETFRAIAEEMSLSYDTVRQIWRHWETHGQLAPNYKACSHPGPRKPREVWEAALKLRQAHPRWGAMVIRLRLLDHFEASDVPSERTLQNWFRKAGLNRTPANQRQPVISVKRGKAVHEVWAVDAKEKLKLADGSGASWLTVVDEASGAILDAEAFPPLPLESGRPAEGEEPPATGL